MDEREKPVNSEYVVIAKIGATYGVQGWLKVFPFTAQLTDILQYQPWYVESTAGWQRMQIKEGREHNKCLVVKVAGYNQPESARTLTGKKIAIQHSQLPALKKDEYYWTDLEGLTVINQHGEELGHILYLLETGANDVLVIKNQGKEHAIPYLPGKVVMQVDLVNRRMHVDWDLI